MFSLINLYRFHVYRYTRKKKKIAPNGYSLLVVGVPQCHSRGEHCANCIHLPRLSGGPGRPVFWGSQPCVPAAWLAERLLLAGDIEPNPGPKPTLKTLTHTLNPHTHQVHAPKISPSELSLPREARRTLAQLRTNKSPILISYLHKVDETRYPSPLCPLCKTHPHTTDHLFNGTHLYTSSNILDLWLSPERVAPLLMRWKRRLAGLL